MPLTFPSRQSNGGGNRALLRRVPRLFTGLLHTACDFGWSLLKSSLIKDDKSPIRSGEDGVEFRPTVTTTTAFSIDQIREIKSRLKVTVNDVITGIIIYGTRLYMQKTSKESGKSNSTALVLLNTRAIGGYTSVDAMIKPDSEMPWGESLCVLASSSPQIGCRRAGKSAQIYQDSTADDQEAEKLCHSLSHWSTS
ncbi:hypothetical protein Sango_0000400 [Sesamum angolense]|uniref:Uncharacterized protein n=1 Tax=Sesamum angolense TaxID=2727404 RepID=A0AAE1XD85_9LAMI|nr:hypothetical protein Sango_0000400 [Sesamum angolense]